MDTNIECWYSMKEITECLGVSRDTALNWIENDNMPAAKICRPSKRNIFDFLISIIVNPICFAAAARAFVHFSRRHHINMKFIARIFHFLYDYIFHIQKFCAIIILVEHTFDPFNWVGVLLLYWISWVCSTFLCKKWDRV